MESEPLQSGAGKQPPRRSIGTIPPSRMAAICAFLPLHRDRRKAGIRPKGEVAGLKNVWVAVDPKRKVVATDSMSRIDVLRSLQIAP